jgi:hypothetical protein
MEKPRRASSNELIAEIEAIEIRLENGTTVYMDMGSELTIPSDPEELEEEARKAPARVAFWSYQEQRALARVRYLEDQLRRKEGEMNLVYRQWYKAEVCGMEPTKDVVQARIDMDSEVVRQRGALNVARRHYGTLRGVREALDHRCNIIEAMTARAGKWKAH